MLGAQPTYVSDVTSVNGPAKGMSAYCADSFLPAGSRRIRETAGVLDPTYVCPPGTRTFTHSRRIRLADTDASGRTRLDAVARLLQDSAIDDVRETGWGIPEHLWVLRCLRADVVAPLQADDEVEIATWCSGVGAIAAGRRWSMRGNAGGRIEVDSVWIHLDGQQRPARIGEFDPYASAAAGRGVSTKLLLPDPSGTDARMPWPLRLADIDTHGHVNNAVYVQVVEDRMVQRGFDLVEPHSVVLDFRAPIDLFDAVATVAFDGSDGVRYVALEVAGDVRAVASVSPLPGG